MTKRYYSGDPGECNHCNQRLDVGDRFYDVRTLSGTWGNFCPACAQQRAVTDAQDQIILGTGYGQRYDRRIVDEVTVWEKTAG